MDFELTATQKDIQQAAREFAEKEFPEVARQYDEKEEFPMPVWKKACDLGFVGVFIQEEYDGPGLGFTEYAMIMEEFWRVDPGCGNLILTAFGAEIIQKFGTEEQKRTYLPLIPSGEAIMCCAITEPDAGSDILLASTTAVKDKDEYVINGSKMFITNGTVANLAVVFCNTDPESGNRHKRHSFFIVETDRSGFETTKIRGKMGIRASDTAELSFNNVRVPAKNLIGGVENEGFKQVMYLFNINRLIAAASGIGVAQGAFEKAVRHIKKRHQFGKPIAFFQGAQFMIAEMATKIEVARNTLHKACWLIDNGKFNPKIISIAKLFAGEIAVSVTNDALQLHGGYGYIAEYDVERFYRDAKIVEIYEGAREIEKITIAREVLGKGE
ncbi:MAG: acyl-CoA dehydrogenase family protein [Proteobacteria bacterium]|nr:acyl-CoA dehydrogenase family protein [Pseudomonadota bacterium]